MRGASEDQQLPRRHGDTEKVLGKKQEDNPAGLAVAGVGQGFNHDGAELDDVAGAKRHDEVAGFGGPGYAVSRLGERAGVCGGRPAVGDALGESLAGDAVDGRFAGCVNIEHGHSVCISEGGGKLVEEQLRAGIAVGLENNVDTAESALARSGESGANLCGVVAVVIDHGHAVDTALELKATVYSVESGQTLADLVDWNIQADTDGNRRGRVPDVVFAGHV